MPEQIRANFMKVQAAPSFSGERFWLTAYLSGPTERLARLADELATHGWTNVGDWEGGFIYPKLEVSMSADDAVEAALNVHRLALENGAEVLNVDADTNPDVGRSEFIALYQSP